MDPKVIGEGSYGCVHKPSLKCQQKINKLKTYNNKISKILNNKEANSEMNEFKVIKSFDTDNHFHSGTPFKCPPLDNENQRTFIKKCKNSEIKQAAKSSDELKNYLSLLVMEDGGLDIRHFILNLSKRKNTPANIKRVELFFIEFERAFVGIKKLEESGIIHNDLKIDNMVYNEEKNRLNFIDFGLTNKKDKILKNIMKNEYFLSNACHWSFPPDTALLDSFKFTSLQYYLNKNKRTIKSLLDDFFFKDQDGVYNTEWLSIFIDETYPDMDQKDKKNLLKIKNNDLINSVKSYKDINQKDFYNKSLDTIDSYGLGMALCFCIHKLKKFIDNNLFSQLLGLCNTMTNWNVNNRLSCSELLNSYQNILSYNNILNKHNLKIDSNKIVKTRTTEKDVSTIFNLPTTKEKIMIIPPDPPKEIDLPPPPQVIEPTKTKKRSTKKKTSSRKNKTQKDNYSNKQIFNAQQLKNRFHRLKGKPELAEKNYKHTYGFPRLSKIRDEIRRMEIEQNKSPLLNPSPIKK